MAANHLPLEPDPFFEEDDEVLKALDRAEQSLDEGNGIPADEVRRRLDEWASKLSILPKP